MSMFGGGASKQAAADAEKSRKLQQISNDRQLGQTAQQEQQLSPSRKAPRGRKLFVTDFTSTFNNGLSNTLGGGSTS